MEDINLIQHIEYITLRVQGYSLHFLEYFEIF